jgi:hypothetical protein
MLQVRVIGQRCAPVATRLMAFCRRSKHDVRSSLRHARLGFWRSGDFKDRTHSRREATAQQQMVDQTDHFRAARASQSTIANHAVHRNGIG